MDSYFRAEVRKVELIGEIAVNEQNIDILCQAMGKFDLNNAISRWPHCMAICIVGIARYRYDGDAFWSHVGEAFGTQTSLAQQSRIGQWFEGYLRSNRLPSFHHLVEQGALRYLTPILAHAIIPRALVSSFVQQVILPSVQNPQANGSNAEDIQARFVHGNARLPRALERFVLYGGKVAQDFIERSLLAARHTIEARTESVGLPDWLHSEIRSAVSLQRTDVLVGTQFNKRPLMKFDPAYGRIQVELPYLDEEGEEWAVQLPNGQMDRHPWLPRWNRVGRAEMVDIDRPFVKVVVTLTRAARVVGTWTFEGFRENRPALFFDVRNARLVGADGYLAGTEWYVIAPKGCAIESGGNSVEVLEQLGQPLGSWNNFRADVVSAPRQTELSVSLSGRSSIYRLVAERPNAQIQAPTMPDYLVGDGNRIVAFESDLPVVLLPPPTDELSLDSYLKLWTLQLASDVGEERHESIADELSPEVISNGQIRLRLEALVPGHDVGDWTLSVVGPLGRGLTAELSLLPDMQFDVHERPALAGRETAASRVFVTTPAGMRVLEDGDLASPAVGGWVLHDRNHNGRVPFSIQDVRTGRTATATVRLRTVQWHWFDPAHPGLADNTPEHFTLDTLDANESHSLLVSQTSHGICILRLVDTYGNSLQQMAHYPSRKRGAVFALAPFLTTARGAGLPRLKLRLELRTPSGELLDDIDVAELSRDIVLGRLESERTDPSIWIRWTQDVVFPGTSAQISSLNRPWEPPVQADVTLNANSSEIELPCEMMPPGDYEITLWHEDGWIGRTRVAPPVLFKTGTQSDIERRLQDLPPTAAGVLETILTGGPQHRSPLLRNFAAGAGPHLLAEVVELIARALRLGRAADLLALPWHESVWAFDDDLLPLLTSLATNADVPDLPRFCAALGLDASAALHEADIESTLRPGLWACWRPLGAFVELPTAIIDRAAALRGEENLGWSLLGYYSCSSCDIELHGNATCPSCATPRRSLPEIGSIRTGAEFVPSKTLVAAMRDALLPLPGTQFDADGWTSCALSTLESLVSKDPQQLEQERDSWIDMYRRDVQYLEPIVAKALKVVCDLNSRNVNYLQYPWAYVSRISLVVALARRLVARRLVPTNPNLLTRLSSLAEWLQRELPDLYERDLCYAEIACCLEYDWK